MDLIGVVMEWLHLAAAATLIGGAVYARAVVFPSLAELPQDARLAAVAQVAARMKPVFCTALVVSLLTGLYNLIHNIAGKPVGYHITLTLKLLLALHVYAIAVLASLPPGSNPARDARRPRLIAGAAISGLGILLLSAFLRRSF